MEKGINVDPSKFPPESRVWVQKWLFSTGESYLTKIVDEEEEEVPIEDYTEVTADHLVAYFENNVKVNVHTFKQETNRAEFESEHTDVILES